MITMGYTEHDQKLIEQARQMSIHAWPEIDKLIEQAETNDAKQELLSIQKCKYHREEYKCGVL